MTPPTPQSESPETKEDYEILTAWININAPGKPALREPIKCIRLTTYERLDRRLREALTEPQAMSGKEVREACARECEGRADDLARQGLGEHAEGAMRCAEHIRSLDLSRKKKY